VCFFCVTLSKAVCAVYLHDYWYELLHVFNKTLRVCKFNQCANNMLLTNTLSFIMLFTRFYFLNLSTIYSPTFNILILAQA